MDIIIKKLQAIEEQEGIKILYAVESGSRAWGFESTDSDYDIRFIYTHPLEWYISIADKRDIIEYPIQDLLDFNGWDIRKALQLFTKSNPPLYEWLVSPIIYKETGFLSKKLKDLASQYYSLETCMFNYLHMAMGENKNHLQDEKIKTKKYFYALRPIFACMWIEEYKSLPPMRFIKMMEKLDLNKELKNEVENLLLKKKNAVEAQDEIRIELLNNFITGKIQYFEEYVKIKNFGKKPQINTSVFDKLLLEVITSVNK